MSRAWVAWDDSGERVPYTTDTAEDAATQYAEAGSWSPASSTWWCHVWVAPADALDEVERHKVPMHPAVPPCVDKGEHYWLTDRDGIRGHGGGVVVSETCDRCGTRMITDTWGQDRIDGEQGLRSVLYADPTE